MAVYLTLVLHHRESLNEEWRLHGFAGFDARARAHCLERRITDLETDARRRCKKEIDAAIVEQMKDVGNDIPVSVWERLRSVFVYRLISYELQRQCNRAELFPPINDPKLEGIVMDMLTTESRFGGVFEEELIRVLRSVYPHIARQLLPSTPMERIQDLSRVLVNRIPHISEVSVSANDKPRLSRTFPPGARHTIIFQAILSLTYMWLQTC